MYLLSPIGGSYGWPTLLGVIISLTFIGGNIAFLRAVRNKYAAGVRTAVIANVLFMVSMTGILIVWLIYRSTSHWSFNRYFVFITRVLILIFMWYDLHNVTDVAAQFPLDKWPGFLEMLGRSLAGLLVLALIPIAIFDSEDRVVFLKAILG